MSSNLALYLHWPYCKAKCPYCDFNSHVAATIDHAAWADAYQRSLQHYARLLPGRTITSIFFGGGTPSLMATRTVSDTLQAIAKHWRVADAVEITLEANPTSVEAEKFIGFSAAGVNRLSLGVQSLRDDALKFLGREHDAAEARQAIALAARYFQRRSFDLIYARHQQTPEDWVQELQEALAFGTRHLSLYQLTIEPNTQFYTLAQRRVPLTAPDEAAAQVYEMTNATLAAHGLPAYEISNYAAAGQASRHNLTYWRYEDYLGIGPGAHGRFCDADGVRHATEDHRAPEVWLRQVTAQGHGLRVNDIVDQDTAQREAVMMGLRLTDGIALSEWHQKFGTGLTDFLPAAKRTKLQAENFLTQDTTHLRATPAGLQRLNAVLGYLLG